MSESTSVGALIFEANARERLRVFKVVEEKIEVEVEVGAGGEGAQGPRVRGCTRVCHDVVKPITKHGRTSRSSRMAIRGGVWKLSAVEREFFLKEDMASVLEPIRLSHCVT